MSSGRPRVASPYRFKGYQNYKNSGIDWIGSIPANWEISRLKNLAVLNPEVLPEDTDPALEIIYVDIGGVNNLGQIVERDRLTFQAAPSRARRLVRGGDVIVSTVRTYLRAIAPIGAADDGTVVSTGFAVVRPGEKLSARFAAYALRAPYFVERVVANSKGVSFPAINESEMATYELAVPSLPEQHAIAAFLDRETGHIDQLLVKKERLVELLRERRSALITSVVAGGLNPKGAMKCSGIEWAALIPVDWEVKRLKSIAELNPLPSEVSGLSPDTEVSFIPMEAVSEYGGLDLSIRKSLSDVGAGFTYFRNDDVVVAKITPCFENGKGALAQGLVNGIAFGTTELHVLRATAAVIPRFMFYITLSEVFRRLGEAEMYGAGGQKRVPESFIKNLKHPLPHTSEQRVIVSYLDRETARIDALASRVQMGINRLRECRAALISAAVTGVIDVGGRPDESRYL